MRYRRARVPGGRFFFTVVTGQRRPVFTTPERIEMLRSAFRTVRAKRPFDIDAIVILPEHMHCIWTLPEDDGDFSTRWRLIKTLFAKRLVIGASAEMASGDVWQKRFWEHTIRDDDDHRRHVEYIHYNPVKHGHVTRPIDWPYSSFSRYVASGTYPADWGTQAPLAADLDLE